MYGRLPGVSVSDVLRFMRVASFSGITRKLDRDWITKTDFVV
jgi:hypothetical protein